MIVAVIALVVAVGLLVVPLVWWSRLPKERPNKHWVPTAARVVGHHQGRAVVRYEPPGRTGTAEMPALPAVRTSVAAVETQLLVLLDPLNPVQPFLMEVWNKREKLRRIVSLICLGLAVVAIGVAVVVFLTR